MQSTKGFQRLCNQSSESLRCAGFCAIFFCATGLKTTNFHLPLGVTMKSAFSRILLLILVSSQLVFGQSPLEIRIKHVEQGLLPSVLIKGSPGWSIQERLKYYKIPGVSIAVIKDFKVEWARSYGVKDLETKEPVTPETLFQAASI